MLVKSHSQKLERKKQRCIAELIYRDTHGLEQELIILKDQVAGCLKQVSRILTKNAIDIIINNQSNNIPAPNSLESEFYFIYKTILEGIEIIHINNESLQNYLNKGLTDDIYELITTLEKTTIPQLNEYKHSGNNLVEFVESKVLRYLNKFQALKVSISRELYFFC